MSHLSVFLLLNLFLWSNVPQTQGALVRFGVDLVRWPARLVLFPKKLDFIDGSLKIILP